MVFLGFGWGVTEESWYPDAKVTGADYKLPPGLAPLARHQKDFTLVQWDQPAAGATYARNLQRTLGELSIDRLATDGVAVAEFVVRRFPGRKVVVLAVSAGTITGLRMVRQRPDTFAAYVGTGQVVDGRSQAKRAYVLAR